MPYAFNADENAHFVPKAIALFGHSYNPHYFVNPPAYTYLLHIVFSVWFGGRDGVYEAYSTDPESVFVVARVTAGVVGTIAVWLLYVCGSRLFDRRVGLLAAALFGVAFLPVFYSHLALNDVPTLAPICLAMVGAAGILRYGRVVDYLVAGVGPRLRGGLQVHRRHRPAAARRGGRGAVPGPGRTTPGDARAGPGGCRGARWRSSSPTRTRC